MSDNINEALKGLNKQYGVNTVVQMNKEMLKKTEIEAISTGCYSLDNVFGCGGIPRGRIIEIFGEESCMHPDTFINYDIRTKDGKSQNSKGGTIERLYNRFHKLPIGGSGNYNREQTDLSDFYVPSINEENAIIKNKVLDVVDCGVKEVFTVITQGGKEITCTKEHKFYVGNGNYLPLESLDIGSVIYVHDNTTLKGRKKTIRYKEIFVKRHPSAKKKVVNGCKYYRLKKSNMVWEANQNGLTFDEYRDLLNYKNDKIPYNDLIVVSKGNVLHHKNLDSLDDSIENLELLNDKEHNRLHAINNGNKLNFIVTEDVIDSIVPAGKVNTYDIKCQYPYNNYIANKIVVHNSGKSTLALFIAAQVQKNKGKVVWVDAEFAFSNGHAKNIGVNVEELILSQPTTGEEALDIVNKMASTGEIDLIVVDSVSALVPEKELDGEISDVSVASQARMLSKALRMIVGNLSNTKTAVIFINQIRQKIGIVFGNPNTTSGGKALKFFSSVRLEVRKGKKIIEDSEVVGNGMKIVGVKNKVGFPFREAEIDLYYMAGIDVVADLFDYSCKKEIITKTGNTYSYKEIKLGVGRDTAKKCLASDKNTFENIVKDLTKLK